MNRLSDFIIIDLIIIFCLNAHTHTRMQADKKIIYVIPTRFNSDLWGDQRTHKTIRFFYIYGLFLCYFYGFFKLHAIQNDP